MSPQHRTARVPSAVRNACAPTQVCPDATRAARPLHHLLHQACRVDGLLRLLLHLRPYLSDEFGFSDIEAGYIYAAYGLLCSVFGLFAGPAIDALDLRSALLVGTVPSFAARLGSALTTDRQLVAFFSISALPLGAAFGLPVFALGVRCAATPCARRSVADVTYATYA